MFKQTRRERPFRRPLLLALILSYRESEIPKVATRCGIVPRLGGLLDLTLRSYCAQVSFQHHRRNCDPFRVRRGGAVEQILVDATLQRFPQKTGDPGDRVLRGGGRRQREQSGSVRVNGELGVRGQEGEELG